MALMKTKKDTDIGKFDVLQIVKVMWNKKWLLLLSSILSAILFLVYSVYFITPIYQASVIFYVNNSNSSVGSASNSISPSDLTAAKSLVDTYIVILKTPETIDEIINETHLNYTSAQMSERISAVAMNSTELFKVNVIGEDPEEILKIAENIGAILPKRISNIVEGSDVRIVNHAEVENARISPSYISNAAIGFILGLFICALFVVIKELLNNTVRSEEYLNQMYNVPILTVVPNMSLQKKSSKYGRDSRTAKESESHET